MIYKTLGKNVLIKPKKNDEVMKGILLPESSKRQTDQAKVICVGMGNHQFSVKVGDTVIFSPYSGHSLQIEGEDHIILSEESIIAILE